MNLEAAILRTEQNLMITPNMEFKVVLMGLLWEKGAERREIVLWEFVTSREHLFNNRTTVKRIKWIASRLHYFNPQYYEVNLKSFKLNSEKTNFELNKAEITTCKRMISKIKNGIENYENKEKIKLIPYLDENPQYLKLKEKLLFYQERLRKANDKNELFLTC